MESINKQIKLIGIGKMILAEIIKLIKEKIWKTEKKEKIIEIMGIMGMMGRPPDCANKWLIVFLGFAINYKGYMCVYVKIVVYH